MKRPLTREINLVSKCIKIFNFTTKENNATSPFNQRVTKYLVKSSQHRKLLFEKNHKVNFNFPNKKANN